MMKKGLLFVALAAMGGCATILGIEDTYVVEEDASPTVIHDASPAYDASLMPSDAMTASQSEAPPEHLVQIHLLNAATSTTLLSPVHIVIAGSSREVVIDEQGLHRTEFPDTYEALRFGLAESATFPVSLVLQVSGPGILTTTYPVVLYERADITAELRLVALDNLPSGVHVARDVSGMADGDGVLTVPIVLETRRDGGELTARVSLPQGLVMHDRDGMPLTGALTVEMAHYESGNVESLAAFPGGMEVSTTKGDGLFSSAGLLSLEITDSLGREAATFEVDQIDVLMTVPTGIMNPDENREIMVGDSIGLWSHNAVTGTWTREGAVKLTGESTALMAQFSIVHLSLWNLDFKINKCDVSREIEVRDNISAIAIPPEIAQHFVYQLTYTNLDGSRPSFSRQFRPGDLFDAVPAGPINVLQFRNAPNESSGRFTITAYWKIIHPECYIEARDFNERNKTPLCAQGRVGFYVNPDPEQPDLDNCPAP